jgi:hypothetical protein
LGTCLLMEIGGAAIARSRIAALGMAVDAAPLPLEETGFEPSVPMPEATTAEVRLDTF